MRRMDELHLEASVREQPDDREGAAFDSVIALETPAGKKRAALEAWFSGSEGPQALFAGRILSFDEQAAIARFCELPNVTSGLFPVI